jgi:hypothetical protein
MKSWPVLLAAGLCWSISHEGAAAPEKDKPPPQTTPRFKVTLRRPDDTWGVKMSGPVAVFSLKSPSGISRAVIERGEEKWPKVVVLYLHLKGLENFRVGNGQYVLHATVKVKDGKIVMRQFKNDQETLKLQRTDPLWLNICPMSSDGKPATMLPLTDGYFEITLPDAFLRDNPKSITLHWVDFFRT